MIRNFVQRTLRVAATAIAVTILTVSCGGGGGPASPPASGGTGGTGGTAGGSTSSDITVQNNSFAPASTTVAPGSTITWTWSSCTGDGYGGTSCADHSVVFDDAGVAGSGIRSSGSFAKTFAAAGSYAYHCSIHGTATSGMRGSIIVK